MCPLLPEQPLFWASLSCCWLPWRWLYLPESHNQTAWCRWTNNWYVLIESHNHAPPPPCISPLPLHFWLMLELENMEYHWPHCHSTLTIAIVIRPYPRAGNSKFGPCVDLCQDRLCPNFTNVWVNHKTWAGRLVKYLIAGTPPGSNAEVQPRHVNPISCRSIQRSKNRYFCPRFDAIGHRLWTALAPKIAEVCIRFWYMLMLGLGPTWLRLSPNHTPSLTPARVSDYCCCPRIDRVLYISSLSSIM